MGQSIDAVDVLVVVVTYNSADVLPGFFEALPEAMDGIDSYRVVVSDNDSSDGSVAMAKSLWPDAIVLESPTNLGYATAINAAVEAGGSWQAVFILNDDIRLGRRTVRTLLDRLDPDNGIGITVPKLVDGDGELLRSLRREPTPLRAYGEAILGGDRAGWYSSFGGVVQDPAAYRSEGTYDWASGCAWLISAQCWDRVGTWDESLFLYSEDVDYALRARDLGMGIRYTPDAEVVHLVGPAHSDARLWAMSTWNRYRVYARRHGRLKSLLFRSGLLLNEVLRSIAGRKVHQAGARALVSKSHRPEEVR